MAEVDILLATYNGEKFIASQLHSLLMQSFRDFRILVHDDGSSDRTIEIVRHFARFDSRIVIIEDNIHFGSPQKNFMHLLSFSTAPWIMFCDQDDIWLDNKVETMLTVARESDTEKPVAVYSQSLFWNSKKGILGKGGAFKAPRNINEMLGQKAGVQGCVAMFNRLAADFMLRFSGTLVMHDYLLELVVLTFGTARHIDIPLMLYRQHDNNVTGNSDLVLSRFQRIKRKIVNPREVMDATHINTTADFLECFREEMSSDQISLFEAFLKMPHNNKLKNVAIAFKNKMGRDRSRLKFILKILISPYISEENRQKLKQ